MYIQYICKLKEKYNSVLFCKKKNKKKYKTSDKNSDVDQNQVRMNKLYSIN